MARNGSKSAVCHRVLLYIQDLPPPGPRNGVVGLRDSRSECVSNERGAADTATGCDLRALCRRLVARLCAGVPAPAVLHPCVCYRRGVLFRVCAAISYLRHLLCPGDVDSRNRSIPAGFGAVRTPGDMVCGCGDALRLLASLCNRAVRRVLRRVLSRYVPAPPQEGTHSGLVDPRCHHGGGGCPRSDVSNPYR